MIYISGKITGTGDYKERFSEAESRLENQGHKVINPARLNNALPELSHEEYMTICMAELLLCDSIYMLKGYENSKGAMQELKWARENGLRIVKE